AAPVQELLAAKRDLRPKQLAKRVDKDETPLIDDISYKPPHRDETDGLFLPLSPSYEHRSVVITNNPPFSKRGQIFKDPVTTVAAIDRLVHHSSVLELNGESYRAVEASKRNKQKEVHF